MKKTYSIFFVAAVYVFIISCNKTAAPTKNANGTDSTVTIALKAPLSYFLRESSGLCFTDGKLWSFGDSGNPNWLFRIDSSSGVITQTLQIANYGNTDWEDITADSNYIYIGDFGNNNGNRKDLKILRVKKSDISDTPAVVTVSAEAINFSYADQTDFSPHDNNNFDCESLVAIGDSLYIFTKDGGDLQTRCYELPKIPGTYTIAPMATFNSTGKVTAATYNPETHELALLGYMDKKVSSFIWFFDGFNGSHFFSGTAKRVNIGDSATDWQVEGLDFISNNRLLMSCETSTSNVASLYSVQKNF